MELITALDVAKRDRVGSVTAWIRSVSAKFMQNGKLGAVWDGRTVSGSAVEAYVSAGRVVASCDLCGNSEYVDPQTPVFYCLGCGNGNSNAARPVKFPDDWTRIKAALEARPLVPGMGRNEIERTLRSKPVIKGLGRNWRPGKTLEELMAENEVLHGE
jgi:hypothetical protein